MWPLPLVTTSVQFDELQGGSTITSDVEDQVNEMEKMWPKMGMMREDLARMMSQTAGKF